MQWIKSIYKFIVHGVNLCELDRSNINQTRRNPATGLPMVGGTDTQGNLFGSNQESRRHDPMQRRQFISTRYYD